MREYPLDLRTQNNYRKKIYLFKHLLSGWILILPTVLILYFSVWRPQFVGFYWSLFKMKGYTAGEFCGLANYINVISDSDFTMALFNTIKYVLWSLIIGFIPPIIIAIMINEVRKFQDFFRITIYLPSILPGIIVMLMWYLLYYPDQSGLLNAIIIRFGIEPKLWLNDAKLTIPLIIVSKTWKGLGVAMLLYLAALQGVNKELYEAADLDGASLLQKVRFVTIPQLLGVIVLNLVMQIIGVFQIMEEPMAMTGGGPNGASMSLGYQMYKYGFVTGHIGESLALGSIMFIILVTFTLAYFYLNKKVEESME